MGEHRNITLIGIFDFAILTLILLFLLFPHTVSQTQDAKCRVWHSPPRVHRYSQLGDFIYGGIISLSVMDGKKIDFIQLPLESALLEIVVTENYQQIVALAFAVKEINENPRMLPNITLGFNIYDSYLSSKWTYHAAIQFLSSKNNLVPNYKCGIQDTLLAVTEDLTSERSHQKPNILGIYKIPQFIYGSGMVVTEKDHLLYYFQMVPNVLYQYRGIMKLIQHFNWNWIEFFIANRMHLECVMNVIIPEFAKNGICTANIYTFILCHGESHISCLEKTYYEVMNSKAKVLVFSGDMRSMVILRWLLSKFEYLIEKPKGHVWLMTAGMELKNIIAGSDWPILEFHGSFFVTVHSNEIQGFHKFLQKRNPLNSEGDGFIRDFWARIFDCPFQDSRFHPKNRDACTGMENLENLPEHVFPMRISSQSYSIYNALYAVAHALHAIYTSVSRHKAMDGRERRKHLNQQLWQLSYQLKRLSFNNSAGDQISFDQEGSLLAGFDIINWITFPNQSFIGVKVGRMDPWAPPHKKLIIKEEEIVWHHGFNQSQPISLCNANCQPGYQKETKEGEPFCCYNCVTCPKGWISNKTDMDNCFKCPQDQYANKEQNRCIPKVISYLSYEEPLGISIATCTVLLSTITIQILKTFRKHQNTHIVKANNRDLSYLLLISLLLCFLCSLLFLGRPITITCLLRQTTFGVIFTMAVSCVLTKTLIVVLAFMAKHPGSKMKKWTGRKLAIFIVFSCTFPQVGICVVWLATSPPFPDSDMLLMSKEVVLQCNESSPIMFYLVLCYLGLLAIASFTVAFFARKLPDTFNEAKFIAFSMLVFCTVWLTFVPTYLGTKGKNMVTVEIFSILSSSAGLLGCIFAPKCYIILLRPELNKREHLISRKI
ncbi:type-2 vomeronasal receptor [Crotalus adamanteus]|nr:type-2 vomeronasal receptor [Crotalus adamanteus]